MADAQTLSLASGEQHELTGYLQGLGLPLTSMIEAARSDQLVAAAFADHVHPQGELNLEELAQRAGVSVLEARRILRALGIAVGRSNDASYVEADAELVRVCADAIEALPGSLAYSVLRVVGSSFDRIADSAVGRYFAVAQPGIDVSAMPLDEQARGIRSAAEVLCTGVQAMAPRLLAHHLWGATSRYWAARRGVTAYETACLAVGFVDLVGFTPLSQHVTVSELERLVSRFESVSYDAAAANGGRVVKLIGDEVMFVALDGVAACEIALTLLVEFGEDGAILPRAGVAFGELLARDGDYYGPTVNLASRIGDIAVPNELLVTNPVADQLLAVDDLFAIDRSGRRMLKGFDDPVEVCSVRRPN
ncbi:MAG: hypothetical protein HYX32_00020 [Actinobacteria bacterium]|nr:hypothetical protein [Actinomycetota bacterium]